MTTDEMLDIVIKKYGFESIEAISFAKFIERINDYYKIERQFYEVMINE